jgi:hypothetical protein
MQRNNSIILSLVLPLAHAQPLLYVPFAKNGSQLIAAQAWSVARAKLIDAVPELAANWLEVYDCFAIRTQLQSVRAEAETTWNIWQKLFHFLWSVADCETYDVPGSQPLFCWNIAGVPMLSHSLVFESAALLYTLLAAHQNLAIIAYAQRDIARAHANLDKCAEWVEHAVRYVLPLHGTMQIGDAATRAPALLSRHLWCDYLAPLIVGQKQLMTATPAERPYAFETSAWCTVGSALLCDALANVVPLLLGETTRQNVLRQLATLSAESQADLGVHLATFAAPTLNRTLLEIAWSLMQSRAKDDHIVVAVRRCIGTLRVIGSTEPRPVPVVTFVSGKQWSYSGGVLEIPLE